ncbi:hypothetical protein [Mucilaginibacter rubeus]|jgi:hypothetical protein|nr:hypothetical protein [Mucilaginibacter rubeus]
MKTKLKKLTFPKYKSLYKYHDNQNGRFPTETDPTTVTIVTTTHLSFNK